MTARRALRLPPAIMRLGMRQVGRRYLDPALPWPVQRTRLDQADDLGGTWRDNSYPGLTASRT